ncbi:ATP-binding protein [Microcoleus sp. CAWBG58]|uniref:sensor histidine kinase n=1 Tax=Microcoleus sp. CAWBG58 TaxID=2841651 RepID=UPI0025EB094B|nr:ATP-binding protein [Microcoleus sp. CAWBG58]
MNRDRNFPTQTRFTRRWERFFGEARTRILIWYILLIALFLSLSIPAIRQRLFALVDGRVKEELNEEITVFNEKFAAEFNAKNQAVGQRLTKKYGVLKTYFPPQELSAFFDIHLSRQITEDDTFLLAIVEGKFYKSSSKALPKQLQPDSELVETWAKLSQPERGEQQVSDSKIGSILYAAEPVKIEGKTLGVFVVAHMTGGERQEALEAFKVVIEVTLVVLILVILPAWIAAGKLLAPLRALTATARAIEESDLSQRLVVRGQGEIAELATTFNEMMDRLEEAFATQRNFINDAGHELRTPITIVRGHLELMGDDPEEQAETMDLVMDELDRMSRFVDDLVVLAKVEQPDFLQLETVDVGALTEELFAKAKALGNRNWELDAAGKSRIVADRQRITQAVMNLAQNAVQHTESEDAIAIGSAVTGSHVRFWVRDTGEGIAPIDQQRIFERFARAANSRRRSEGAGLGLSIVRAIAEAHGGKVSVSSQLGTGSTFALIMPIEPFEGKKQLTVDS